MNETNELLTANIEKPNYYAWIFTTVVLSSLVLWLFSIFYNGVYATQFDIFFKRCGDLFADFTNVCGFSAGRNPYNNTVFGAWEHAQPPLAYFLGYIFSRIIVQPEKVYRLAYLQPQFLVIFVIMMAFIITLINSFVASQLQGSSTLKFLCALAITFCGPMLALIERANFLFISILCCMVFCFWYDSESKLKRELALLCLGLASALKLNPCPFGVLLLIDKRYKDALKCAAYGILLFFLPFLFLDGGFGNIPTLISNINAHFIDEHLNTTGLTLKFIALDLFGISLPEILVNIIGLFVAALFLSSSFKYEKKWQTILAVSLVVITFPKISMSYNILYLIPSLIFFLNEKNREKTDIICLLGYTLMCSVYFFNPQINYQIPVLLFCVFMIWKSVSCWISKS